MKKKIILFLAFLIPVLVFAFTYDWEIDYMEYANDTAAQAAYVSSDKDTAATIDSYSETNQDGNMKIYYGYAYEAFGQAITLDKAYKITSVKFYLKKVGSPTGNLYAKLYASTGTVGTDAKPTGAVLATSGAYNVASLTTSYQLIEFTFSGGYAASAGDICFLVDHRNGTAGASDYIYIGRETGSPTHEGNVFYGDTEWLASNDHDACFYLYGTYSNLQSYSESTIKQQGTYSLKGVAVITDSLSDTLTRTIGDNLDLSNCTGIEYDIYASRTGSNIKIGIHDSGGTTSEHTANVASSNVNQTESWDISGVSDANKDDIDSIIVTIMNADAANTFYLDDLKAGITPAAGGNYTFVQ